MESLARYLKRHGLSQSEFGRSIGTSGAVVCRWLSGKRRPTADWIFVIERATSGAVPGETWEKRRERGAA